MRETKKDKFFLVLRFAILILVLVYESIFYGTSYEFYAKKFETTNRFAKCYASFICAK